MLSEMGNKGVKRSGRSDRGKETSENSEKMIGGCQICSSSGQPHKSPGDNTHHNKKALRKEMRTRH